MPPEGQHIARWDLDKTYLRTDFDTLRDLVRTALERADEKRAHPGATMLMRELQTAGIEIHVLSGSPQQMRRRIAQKLELDGVTVASLTLKPNLRNLLRLRFRSIRGQLGYKLPALLAKRNLVPPHLRETLVGDDAEADALIYSLYSDLCAGIVGRDTLRAVMEADRCHSEEIEEAEQALESLPHQEGSVVERMLIHLDRRTHPHEFEGFGPRLVPFYNYFQAALVLLEDGRIGAQAALRVGLDLVVRHHFDGDALVRSFLEVARRGHLGPVTLDALLLAASSWPAIDSGGARFLEDEAPGSSRVTAEVPAVVLALRSLQRQEAELRQALGGVRAARPGPPDYLRLVEEAKRA